MSQRMFCITALVTSPKCMFPAMLATKGQNEVSGAYLHLFGAALPEIWSHHNALHEHTGLPMNHESTWTCIECMIHIDTYDSDAMSPELSHPIPLPAMESR